jgi:hypothetical protein
MILKIRRGTNSGQTQAVNDLGLRTLAELSPCEKAFSSIHSKLPRAADSDDHWRRVGLLLGDLHMTVTNLRGGNLPPALRSC